MSTINQVIQSVISYAFYPAIVLSVIAFLIMMSLHIIIRRADEEQGDARNVSQELIRRAVGGSLPYIVLIFVVAGEQSNELANFIDSSLLKTSVSFRFLAGSITGILVLEVARILMRIRSDAGEAMAAFFFSTLGAFVLFVLMEIGLSGVQIILFGAIVAGGFDIIFFGVPGRWR